MAYNEKHLVKLADLKALGTKQKEVADALAARVDTLENVGSQANVLEGVKVNGTALSIANKMVDILIATGSKNGSISVNGADVAIKGLAALAFKAKVSQSDLDEALAAILEGKADKATTLDGYGITNAYTKDEINAKISAVYKPAGAVAFAELPSLSESILGNVYNVTDAFTTTANFVEDAGNKYPKGTNVVVVKVVDAYKYDVLAGFVDLSGYVEKEAGKGLSDENFTAALKDKLDGIAAGANKYVHPTHTAAASGFYKTTVDEEGHVTATTPVTKDDITKLGIPEKDTTYGKATAAADGLMSAADKMAEKGDTKGIVRLNYLAMALLGLLFAIVCTLGMLGGSAMGTTLSNLAAKYAWIMAGLGAAGGMMRFVGFATLLRIMLSNEFWGIYFAGFALATIIGYIPELSGSALLLIAFVGIAIALYDYQTRVAIKQAAGSGFAANGGDDEDGI